MILGLIVILLSIAIGLIPSIWGIRKPKRNGKKPLTYAGIILIALLPITVTLQLIQIKEADTEKKLIESKAKNDRDELTKIFIRETVRLKAANESFIVQNNKSIVDPFAKGLLKYGLKFDTAKLEIQRIVKDSLKLVVYNDVKPEISYSEIMVTLSGDSIKHQFVLMCQQATIYNFKANVYLIARTNDDRLFLMGKMFPFKFNKWVLNGTYTSTFTTFGVKGDPLANTKAYYYLIRGNYQDNKGKIFVENELIEYSKFAKGLIALTEKEYIWVKDFCDKRNLN